MLKNLSTKKVTVTPTPGSDIFYPPQSNKGNLENLVNKAKNDLANNLKVDPAQIKTVKSEEKQWSDTSLGCPQPGKMYAQVITPGYLIVLEATGKTYTYHTNLKEVILCP